MKLIDCSTNKNPNVFTMVDNDDYEHINQWKWYVSNGYVMRTAYSGIVNKPTRIYMHREIAKPEIGLHVDHVNGNKLDNRRVNLRVCTNSQNIKNMQKKSGTSSFFKGVSWHNRDKVFQSRIEYDYKSIYLGSYESEISGAIAYNIAALKYHLDFARLNPIPFTT